MPDPVILVEKVDCIATITLNRPKAMNALSAELIRSIAGAFDDIKRDPDIGAVIITGAGRAFSAGVDLKELASGKNRSEGPQDKNYLDNHLSTPLLNFDRPIIGAINGVAITGGFELAIACDILIASTEARFADTHARVGILPGAELSQKLSRVVGIYRAKEISLTGNFISAEQAERWGLVNRVVQPEELLPTCRAIANDILSCPGNMIKRYKKLIDDGFQMTYGEGVILELKTNREQMKSVMPETIAKRREGILERGRNQQK